jgi:hypothetical protein
MLRVDPISRALTIAANAREHTESIKNWVQILSVFGIVTGVVNFWYGTYFEPATRPPQVNVLSSLERGGTRDGMTQITGRVTLRNPSVGRAKIVGSIINVYGERMTQQEKTAAAFQRALDIGIRQLDETDGLQVDRHASLRESETVYASVPLDGWSLDPGEETARTFVLHVPADGPSGFDVLVVKADFLVGREGDKLDTISVQYAGRMDGDDSVLDRTVYIQQIGGRTVFHTSGDVSRSFGLAETSSVFELALWPPALPPRSDRGAGTRDTP